jgi:2-dehydropantoate 2-reductase
MSQTKEMLPFMERMHVLGSGSIGLLFGSSIRMAFPSYPLTMLLRPHHQERLQYNKLLYHPLNNSKPFIDVCIQRRSGRPRMVQLPAEIIASAPSSTTHSNSKPIYNLLLATKAPDATRAVASIVDRLDANARIIILCNGALAVQEQLAAQLDLSDGIRIHLACTTHGAHREHFQDHKLEHDHEQQEHEPEQHLYHVVHAGVGQTFIENHASLARLWDQSGLVAESIDSDKMTTLQWHKLAANCIINPLTALLQCKNGQLLPQLLYQKMAQPLLSEILQVAQQSCSTSRKHATCISLDELESFVLNVITDTAQNKSSMLQDVIRQKPTEIEYLNGYIVRKGIQLGVDVTANQDIYSQIQQLTSTQEQVSGQ